ncbi:MAG: hypothetical protein IJN25_08325 [Clostridia bacterium]|nr:hypothetical protein [Oscillospiraceae bacterium]MBQ7033645.1 hypothetical protein [Clostridia bacterium]
MIKIGTRREVFFDTYLINTDKSTADIVLHKPIPEETVLSFDEEWEGNSSYVHFFEDDGIYRMYYIAWNRNKFFSEASGEEDKKLRCCYAESKDGLNWIKPDLGIYAFYGSKNNNIVFMADWLDNFYVFRDDNPACPKEQKYKGIARKKGTLVAYTSMDGIHFDNELVITDMGAFDTLNIVLWDDAAKVYRGYIRSFHDIPIEGGGDYIDYVNASKDKNLRVIPGTDADEAHKHGAGVVNLGKRDIRYIESEDFVTWTEPKRLDFGDSEDIPLYTNQISQYERAPHMFVGFPTRYKERFEWTKSFEALCGKDKRLYTLENISRRHGLALTDCVFMCSRDGFHFTRYDEAFFAAGPEYGHNWVYGDGYPAKGFLTTKSKFDGADNELSMLNREYTSTCEKLRRYTLRMDGFASVHAGATEKVLVTKPFSFEGDILFANLSTSACGYLYFTIEDKDGNAVSSCEMFGDSTDKRIGFTSSLSAFAGKEVVMTVRMREADLYSIRFAKE